MALTYPPNHESFPSSSPLGSTLSFRDLSYDVAAKDGTRKVLVDGVSCDVRAGELLAIMGPSGAGKSTLLDLMAFRLAARTGSVSLNGRYLNAQDMHKISTFVEQEDALIGCLTVRESVSYALRLHLPLLPRKVVASRVDRVLTALGLQGCANQIIGTPLKRGVSGGQKRRVTAACAMVTYPTILLLDEVTSGLDSTSAREVMSAIKSLAVSEGIFCIATIHQPSLETLAQFTNVLLLAQGKTCFSGAVDDLEGFFRRWGHPVPRFKTPADHAMDLLNDDFNESSGDNSVVFMREFFLSDRPSFSSGKHEIEGSGLEHAVVTEPSVVQEGKAGLVGTLFWNTFVLSERMGKNYVRNLLAYGVRAGMYVGMGLMLATIWVKLGQSDSTINDRLSVHFFSVAFLAFMSVAGIPSFIEERSVFYREKNNGLYSTLPFVLASTFVTAVPLFGCALIFCLICYWSIGLHPGAPAFFRFLGILYLAILAAEAQTAVIAALLPVFVAALAIGAFMNGFWMSVGGYFIKARSLPRFWKYSFHYMDYQKYAFELLAVSDLRGLNFQCDTIINGSCVCAYPSSTPEACIVSGDDVLSYLEIGDNSNAHWTAILFCIFVIYRIALYFALRFKSR